GLSDEQKIYQTEGVSSTVLGFGTESEETPELAITLSDAGITAAEDAVNAYLDGCESSTEAEPDGCATWVNDEGVDKIEDIVWTFDPVPEFSIGEFDGSSWEVTTDSDGEFTLSCTIIVDGEKQTNVGLKAGSIPFDVDGTVTFNEDGTATYE